MVEMKNEYGQHRDGTEAVDFRTIGEGLRHGAEFQRGNDGWSVVSAGPLRRGGWTAGVSVLGQPKQGAELNSLGRGAFSPGIF